MDLVKLLKEATLEADLIWSIERVICVNQKKSETINTDRRVLEQYKNNKEYAHES